MEQQVIDLIHYQSKLDSTISLIETEQENDKSSVNIYFKPRLLLNVYSCHVQHIVNRNTLNIALDKTLHYSIIKALENLDYLVSERLGHERFNSLQKYKPFFDQNNSVLVRCFIPSKLNKYYTLCTETIDNSKKNIPFKLPRQGTKLDHVVLEIKNVWIQNNKLGYNFELKEVHYKFTFEQ
jgi:hypothetical protein